ncbi:hypothetical protein [Clostridium saudiense]|uniref:hypothetical protein n=1 Tax=Clostridium saudiense TaxID=1414720 RepID=UPI0018A8FEF3|nr:hypothetical protein [Clostridium saudiense]MDU3522952.1 hypothetical protein [Clostridium saudiense]
MKNFLLVTLKFLSWLWTLFMIFMIFFTIYMSLYLNPKEKISILVYFIFALSALPSIIFLFYRHTIEAAAKLEDPPLNIDKYLNNKNSNF